MMLRARNGLRTAIASTRRASIRGRNASNQAVTPGVPANSTVPPSTFMSFAMPDVSIQPSLPQPQIPYSPDFARVPQKSEELPPAMPEESLPKLSVVSESHTPTFHVPSASPDPQSVGPHSEKAPRSDGEGGILHDISEDLGIPSPQAMKNFIQSFR